MSPTWPSMPTFMHRNSPPPASSVYSPQHAGHENHQNVPGRFSSFRPLSNLFQRLTPRVGQQRVVDDVESATRNHASLYDAPAEHRRSVASTHWPSNPFVDPAVTPPPLNVQRQAQVQRPEAAHAGGLPIAFNAEDIAHPGPPASRPRQHRRQHRRGTNNTTHRRKHRRNPYPTGYKAQSVWKEPGVRVKLVHVAISGLLFLLTLIVFLALQPTTPVFSAPFRVVNSLLIVVFAIVFIHACIRLNLLVRAFKRKQRRIARKNAKADGLVGASVDERIDDVGLGSLDHGRPTTGHARAPYFDDPEIGLPPPGEPFRVILARDEELGLTEDVSQHRGAAHLNHQDEVLADDDHVVGNAAAAAAAGQMHDDIAVSSDGSTTAGGQGARPKQPPPVYGVWRGSVRADPNLLHWQRVPASSAATSTVGGDDEVEHGIKPPSYITDEERRQHAHRGEQGPGLQTLPNTRYLI